MPLEISDLNNEQHQAVSCTEGPLLVLAGAGSGKTRVLTYRIAHLIENLGVSPYQILAITFTNKAAAEMRERLGQHLSCGLRGMMVATFHAMCVRFLRADAHLLGYTRNFSIYDEEDSKRLTKSIFADLNIDPVKFPLNGVRERISKAKNNLIQCDEFEASAINAFDRLVARIYSSLQERLKQADAMDFDDLLLNTWLLLSQNAHVLEAYQNRFLYLHIDEYQDTNTAQYAIASLLAAKNRNIMVVGDDDQSIYSWRGADIRNILGFEKDYPEATVIKLERNYRSTQTILDAANAVIANNKQRKAKQLFTLENPGEKIGLYQGADERDEAAWIAREIERLHKSGRSYRDFALFYRTNAQSRVLEDMLLRAGVPYRIVGGTRFFDRAEIRDVMAYLKLVVNPADEVAAKRIINVPKRGIGKTSLEKIEDVARENSLGFLEAAQFVAEQNALGQKASESLRKFLQLLQDAAHYRGGLRDIIEMIVEKSGLIEALHNERSDEAAGRIENIREFFGVAQEFEQTQLAKEEMQVEEETVALEGITVEREMGNTDTLLSISAEALLVASANQTAASALMQFTEWLALRSDLDSLISDDDYLTLMTAHSAKGLEFPVVFMSGMEESLFPHAASCDNPAGLEEERRLAYVAITRARELLYVTHVQARNLFGKVQVNPLSRFVVEIPQEFLVTKGVGSAGYSGHEHERRGSRRDSFVFGSPRDRSEGRVYGVGDGGDANSRQKPDPQREQIDFKLGDEVDHKVFGRGVITGIEGQALLIHFEKSRETKKLLKGYAPLVKLH